MQVQVVLTMVQDLLSNQEYGGILDQQVYVVTKYQELWNSTRKFVRLAGDYLGLDGSLSQAMKTWPHHTDRFERKYNKAFAGKCLFGDNIVDQTHKRVHLFLNSSKMTSIDGVNTVALAEFGELQRRVE